MDPHTRSLAPAAIDQYEVLASARIRRLVGLLAAQPAPLSPAALAVVRVVEDHDGDPAAISEETIRRARIDLEHSQLPRLADSGLVEYDDDRVTVTDEAVSALGALQATIPDGTAGSGLLEALQSARRRRVVSILANTPHETVTLTSLAVAVTTAEQETAVTAMDQAGLVAVRSSLHHAHLPKLDEVGLLAYDPQTRTVTDTGIDDLDSVWLSDADAVTRLSADGGQYVPTSPEAGIWTLDDHGSVVERFRALADHADDELHVVLTTNGLLTPGCLTHLRLATERGVDVTVGTAVESVRDRIRAAVPNATIWDPHHEWLGPSVGDHTQCSRLVVADRQAAMLATVEGGRVETETAITGDGRDNGLVTAIGELLDSQLDRDDTPDFEFQSPASP